MTQYVGVQQISAGVDGDKQVGSQGIRGVLIGNESGLSTVISMDGTSDSKSLYPGTVDFFPITGGFSGTVKWKTQALLNNVSSWPSSFLQFDTVGINEPFNTSVYPLTLPRLTNIGNTVSSLVNAITNEGQAINTEVIDIGTINIAKLIDIFNDHFVWSVQQAGVAHQVLKGQTAGNPLQLGQAGDIVEILGKLLIDQIATAGPVAPPTGTGTVSIYELTIGPLKIAVCQSVNLQNTSVTKFSLALPTAFTSGAIIVCGFITNTELLAGGIAQTMQVVNALNAGAASGQVAETVLFTNNYGSIRVPFDTLRFQASNATVHDGDILLLVGI